MSGNIAQNPKRAGKVEISCDSFQCKRTTNPITPDFTRQITFTPAKEKQEAQKALPAQLNTYLIRVS